jgi:hypothetical protein
VEIKLQFLKSGLYGRYMSSGDITLQFLMSGLYGRYLSSGDITLQFLKSGLYGRYLSSGDIAPVSNVWIIRQISEWWRYRSSF